MAPTYGRMVTQWRVPHPHSKHLLSRESAFLSSRSSSWVQSSASMPEKRKPLRKMLQSPTACSFFEPFRKRTDLFFVHKFLLHDPCHPDSEEMLPSASNVRRNTLKGKTISRNNTAGGLPSCSHSYATARPTGRAMQRADEAELGAGTRVRAARHACRAIMTRARKQRGNVSFENCATYDHGLDDYGIVEETVTQRHLPLRVGSPRRHM